MNNNPKVPQDIKLDIAPDVAVGVYSNLAVISHSPTEITIDFAQMLPGTPNPNVRSRVIMNPVHAKHLLQALADNIQKYEKTFGPIAEPQGPKMLGDTVPYDLLGKA